MPSLKEWESERAGLANRGQAYEKLLLPSAGYRYAGNGVNAGVYSFYYSRTTDGDNAWFFLAFSGSSCQSNRRFFGFSVRCIKME